MLRPADSATVGRVRRRDRAADAASPSTTDRTRKEQIRSTPVARGDSALMQLVVAIAEKDASKAAGY
jgi:hypothetical protein